MLFRSLELDRGIRRMVLDGAHEDELRRHAVANGFVTLRREGLSKILEGVTTIEEVRGMTLGDLD